MRPHSYKKKMSVPTTPGGSSSRNGTGSTSHSFRCNVVPAIQFTKYNSLPSEIQNMIQRTAIHNTKGLDRAKLACIDKEWQIEVERVSFHDLTVDVDRYAQDVDNNTVPHEQLHTMLNPERLVHLHTLTLKMAWPFFKGAQAKLGFSKQTGVSELHTTNTQLARLLAQLGAMTDAANTPPHIAIRLEAIRPPFMLCAAQSERGNTRRMAATVPAVLSSMWSPRDMADFNGTNNKRRLEYAGKVQGPAGEIIRLRQVAAVTSLSLSPDFFPRKVISALLKALPNLSTIEAVPMCLMSETAASTHATTFFGTDLLAGAPDVVTLKLGRNDILTHVALGREILGLVQHNDLNDPVIDAHLAALRTASLPLRELQIEHYANHFVFWQEFFLGAVKDDKFFWPHLEKFELIASGQKPPSTAYTWGFPLEDPNDPSSHMWSSTRLEIIRLFSAAAQAAARMPKLKVMTIHCPATAAPGAVNTVNVTSNLKHSVTLRFTTLEPGGRRRIGAKLEVWNVGNDVREHDYCSIEKEWRTMCREGNMDLQIIWWSLQCPNPRV